MVTAEEVQQNDREDDDDDSCPEIIFILEGMQLGYGSKTAWTLV